MQASYGPIERQCWRKQPYTKRKQAEAAMSRVRWRSVLPLRVYHCPVCGKWHVGRVRRDDAR
jgi:hypothetical protein